MSSQQPPNFLNQPVTVQDTKGNLYLLGYMTTSQTAIRAEGYLIIVDSPLGRVTSFHAPNEPIAKPDTFPA